MPFFPDPFLGGAAGRDGVVELCPEAGRLPAPLAPLACEPCAVVGRVSAPEATARVESWADAGRGWELVDVTAEMGLLAALGSHVMGSLGFLSCHNIVTPPAQFGQLFRTAPCEPDERIQKN